ncbi:MAG: DEAD/DEAH box helicase [candidate division WOR-3 bacterium]|nr:DEAD/DEAH box helicase [candidate division WOR-3 bacterium]
MKEIIVKEESKFTKEGGYVVYVENGKEYKEDLISAELLNPKLNFKFLNPVQTVFYKFYENKSALVATPTSSGKTICALHFIQKHIGLKVYTVPTKSLANEIYNFFKKIFINVDLRTGDVIEEAYEIRSDLVVCTYESLLLSIRNGGWGYNASAIVIDEIHFIFSNRGSAIEEIVAFLKMKDKADILGLSATLPMYMEIARWIEAKLVIKSNFRPVKLIINTQQIKL